MFLNFSFIAIIIVINVNNDNWYSNR